MITKMLVGAAIAFGSIAGAATASADPNPCGAHPNPFGGLTSSPHEKAPAGAGTSDEFHRGMREALAR
jgi:hypothetical protein